MIIPELPAAAFFAWAQAGTGKMNGNSTCPDLGQDSNPEDRCWCVIL
jgi:hypothetical protein